VKKSLPILIVLFIVLGTLQQCATPSIPKPEGYFRINLPNHSFIDSEVDCGLSLERPSYSVLEKVKNDSRVNSCWFNLWFPQFKARLHCTQVDVNENLIALMNDAQAMVFSHEMKANGISRVRITEEDSGLNGVLFHLGGPVATPIQFFVTDSTDHFLRGSPVVSRLLGDVEHIMRSISWD
jgi:gliding motility-associated lipoprotein GldD